MSFDLSQESYQSLRAIVAERTNRVVAWVGSGMSVPAGLPDWKSLRDILEGALVNKAESLEGKESVGLKNMAKTIHSMADIWTAFELLRLHLGDTTWRIKIREAFGSAATTTAPEGYENIWKLGVRGILSLNLDRFATKAYSETMARRILIEFSGKEAGNFTHVLKNPGQFVCNLHGHVEDVSSWVLTKSELKSLLKNPSYKTFVTSCLTSNTIIFFGIKVDDTAVGSYLEGLTELGIDFGEHYWVTSRRDIETDKFAESIGVRLIRYDATKDDRSELSELFADLCSYVSPEDGDVEQPAFIGPYVSEDIDLPNSRDILQLDTEAIRKALNNHAIQILASHSPEAYKKYEDFSEEYDEAVYRAWYTSIKPWANTLCGYKLIREIAYGAFGKVFLANASDGREVAVKVLHEEIRRDSDLLHSFRRGVRSMSILSEHNVQGMVAYRDASEIPAFVVMDLIDGPSLNDAVQARQIEDWGTILKIGENTSSVVRQGHLLPERVLHRDLRPSNIMLKGFYANPDDWDVVVLDFDLSWYRGSFEKSIVHGSALLGYLAPEQIQQIRGVSTRNTAVDSFGLGMTLFFMCGGRNPVPDEHLHRDWVEAVYDAARRVPQCAWWSITNRFARLIIRATQQNQRDRWDMAQIEGELQRLLEAVENPGSVKSAELVAEEIAARCHFMEDYSWDDDKARAKKETPTGIEVCIGGDESLRVIRIDISWGLPGVHGRGESVGKWIPERMVAAVGILKRGGWTIEGSEKKWANIRIRARVEVSKALSSFNKIIGSVEDATGKLRFE